MRPEDVAPRTLVLGAVAGWALAAWLLALAGMGGHLPDAGSDSIPPPALPPMPRETAAVLGPPAQYAATSERPLFSTDRRPHPFTLQAANGQPTEAPAFDLVLTSVLITPQASIAIVQKPDGSGAWRVRMGDAPEAYPNWRLVAIAPRSATFAGPEGEQVLALRVFDGQGGTAPTAVGPVPPPPPPTTMPGPGGPAGPSPLTAPATDASTPDPAQIEAIRRRIEARREQQRQRAQNANPPATVAPPPSPPTR